jgi:formamidopyrimidine-DNA glycosylase
MIAGRLRWFADGGKPPNAYMLARLNFRPERSLHRSRNERRASLHLVRGEAALAALDPRGLEV